MKPDFASIFLLSRSARPGDKVVDPRELTRILDLYDRIKLETAHKAVEHWRLDPDYLFALKQLNAQQQQATGQTRHTADPLIFFTETPRLNR